MSDPNEKITPAPSMPLIGRDRIRGASRVIAEGTDAAKVSEDQIAAVASDVEIFRRAHNLHRRDIATAIGYTAGVVSEFLNGNYKGNRGQLAIDLESWLIEEESRRSRDESTSFTWTNVAQLIKATANYCLDMKRIGLVYGPDSAGIGKTTALQAIHQSFGPRRSSLLTLDKMDASPTGVIQKLCTALRLSHTHGNRNCFNKVVAKLRGRSHILLIDQIHNLCGAKGDKPFFILADLFDATEVAQLWVGTNDLVGYLNRQRVKTHDESLAQIRRRVFPCVDLMEACRGSDGGGDLLVTTDQIRAMFARSKLRLTPDAWRFLCKLANTPDSGGIGLCVQLVQYATIIADLAGQTAVDVSHLRQAMRQGFMADRAAAIEQRSEEAFERKAMVG
jgi:DNA transposition AAA+ family ATPase